MKSLYFFLLLNIMITKVKAQNADFSVMDTSIITKFEAKLTAVVINPGPKFSEKCLNKEWCLSSILLYNNELVKNKNLKYNGFDDSFIWLEPTSLKQTRLDREFIKEISMKTSINEDSLHFRKMKIKRANSVDSADVFLNVMVEGKISLYVLRQINFESNTEGYKPVFQFYLKKQDSIIYHFKPNKLALLSQFPDKKKELKKIIRKNGLMIREEKDLIKAIKFLNLEI